MTRPDNFIGASPVQLSRAVLAHSAARLRSWTVDAALPFWVDHAQLDDGSWVEHLRLDGIPDHSAERRWRIVARQAVAYAQATQAGWWDGTSVARRSFEAYWSQGWTRDHIVHRILPDGTISDPRSDLYDQAFGLLACARLFALTGEAGYRYKAAELIAHLDASKHPAGGWREGTVKPFPRRQNPHMHLLEASLALHQATGQADDLAIAHEVIGLFERHFLRGDTIGEIFNEDWSPHPEHGDCVEPGHAAEWIWLLSEYDKATGADHSCAQYALYERVFRNRLGILFDIECRSGDVTRQTTRAWVQTEAIKAHLAMAERGAPGATEMAASTIDAMFGTILQPDGTWADQHNACGAPIATTIPVSTMYHIVGMAVEAERVSGGRL